MLQRGASLAVVVLLLAALPVAAGVGAWTPAGPDGGTVTALDIAPNGRTAYAATIAGTLFKTVDRGRTWMGSGAVRGRVRDLDIDAFQPARVYVAAREGLWVSADNGRTWEGLIEGEGIHSLAADPRHPGVLFAGRNATNAFLPTTPAVLRTADSGDSWSPSGEGIQNSYTEQVVVDPKAPGALYARDQSRFVWRSLDGGATWTLSRLPVPIFSLTFDAGSPAVVYAGGAGGRAFVSRDGGATWTSIGAGLPFLDVAGLAADPHHHGTVYGALFGGGIYSVTRLSTATAPGR
jgi:photosystem II stability/assembly factor-like uncharacterized protein